MRQVLKRGLVGLGLVAVFQSAYAGEETLEKDFLCAQKLKGERSVATYKIDGTLTAMVKVDDETLYLIDKNKKAAICRVNLEGHYHIIKPGDEKEIFLSKSGLMDLSESALTNHQRLSTQRTDLHCTPLNREGDQGEAEVSIDDVLGELEGAIDAALSKDVKARTYCNKVRSKGRALQLESESLSSKEPSKIFFEKIKSFFGF